RGTGAALVRAGPIARAALGAPGPSRPGCGRAAPASASGDPRGARTLAAAPGPHARAAHAAYAAPAGPRVAPAGGRHRSRGGGGGPDAGTRAAVLAADEAAAVGRAGVHADGTPRCTHGRGTLRFSRGGGYVAARRVRDGAV